MVYSPTADERRLIPGYSPHDPDEVSIPEPTNQLNEVDDCLRIRKTDSLQRKEFVDFQDWSKRAAQAEEKSPSMGKTDLLKARKGIKPQDNLHHHAGPLSPKLSQFSTLSAREGDDHRKQKERRAAESSSIGVYGSTSTFEKRLLDEGSAIDTQVVKKRRHDDFQEKRSEGLSGRRDNLATAAMSNQSSNSRHPVADLTMNSSSTYGHHHPLHSQKPRFSSALESRLTDTSLSYAYGTKNGQEPKHIGSRAGLENSRSWSLSQKAANNGMLSKKSSRTHANTMHTSGATSRVKDLQTERLDRRPTHSVPKAHRDKAPLPPMNVDSHVSDSSTSEDELQEINGPVVSSEKMLLQTPSTRARNRLAAVAVPLHSSSPLDPLIAGCSGVGPNSVLSPDWSKGRMKLVNSFPINCFQRGRYRIANVLDPSLCIVVDKPKSFIHVSAPGIRPNYPYPEETVSFDRIQKLLWGRTSNKVQVWTSKQQGLNDKLHIEFPTAQCASNFSYCLSIVIKRLVVKEISCEKLDRIFERQGRFQDDSADIDTNNEFLETPTRVAKPSRESPDIRQEKQPPKKRRKSEKYHHDQHDQRDQRELSRESASVPLDSIPPSPVSYPDRTELPGSPRSTPTTDIKTGRQAKGVPTETNARDDTSGSHEEMPAWKETLVYPPQGQRRATVEYRDLSRLKKDEYLNDNLITFYLRFLEEQIRKTNPELSNRLYFFNSYFFSTLTGGNQEKLIVNYDAVRKWTKAADLFDKDYIIVPINHSLHWFVIIICNLSVVERNFADHESDSRLPSKGPDFNSTIEPKSSPHRMSSRSLESEHDTDEINEGYTGRVEQSISIDTDKETGEPKAIVAEDEADIEAADVYPHIESPIDSVDASSPGDFRETSVASKTGKRRPLRGYDPTKIALITLDSLALGHAPATRVLKEYIQAEGHDKRALSLDISEMRGITAKSIPRQSNCTDCGVYLIAYIEKFVEDPVGFVENVTSRHSKFEETWMIDPTVKRFQIRTTLQDLYAQIHGARKTINLSGSSKQVLPKPSSSKVNDLLHSNGQRNKHKDDVKKSKQMAPVPVKRNNISRQPATSSYYNESPDVLMTSERDLPESFLADLTDVARGYTLPRPNRSEGNLDIPGDDHSAGVLGYIGAQMQQAIRESQSPNPFEDIMSSPPS